jgi:hypothetical protein
MVRYFVQFKKNGDDNNECFAGAARPSIWSQDAIKLGAKSPTPCDDDLT